MAETLGMHRFPELIIIFFLWLSATVSCQEDDSIGLPCSFNSTSSSPYSVQVHLNNRLLTTAQDVPHGSELTFHCPIQRYYRLSGPSTVYCRNGQFTEKLPFCEAVLISNRLTAIVDTEYILGPGGEYVVFSGSQVRMSCYHALSRSYRPSWQWTGKVDHVFIEEKVSFGQVTVVAKFEVQNDTSAVFTCTDPTEDIHIKIVARPLHCPKIVRSSGLTVVQTSWLRADFYCPPGSILLGERSANCMQFRQWDAPSPICAFYNCQKRKLKDDGTQDDGLLFPCQLPELSGDLVAHSRSSSLQSLDVVPHGADVEFNCLDFERAQKIGAGETRCLNGNWTSPPPVCAIPERATLQGVLFDFDFRYRFGPTGVLYVEPKTEVTIKCISPTKLMPTLNYTVIDELSPVFIINAEAEDSSAVARIVTFNTGPKFDAKFWCITNETNVVNDTRTIRITTKESRCGPFESREGLRHRIEGNLAVFECDQPARLLGHSILRCEDGYWDHAQPMCVFQERCAGWREDANEATEDAGGFKTNENITYVVREKQVLQENASNYQQLDAAAPTVRPPLRPLVAAIEEAEEESADETDEELRKIAEEVDREENDLDPPEEEDEEAIKRPLNPPAPTAPPTSEPLVCSKPSGMFSYPTDCRRFIHCSNGVAKVMRCPHNFIFSPSSQMCKAKDDETGCYADE